MNELSATVLVLVVIYKYLSLISFSCDSRMALHKFINPRFRGQRHQRIGRGQQVRHNNRHVRNQQARYTIRQRQYSRITDCWNCGRKDHRKENCPLPHSLRCSFCLRNDVRSDQCPCRRLRQTSTSCRPDTGHFQPKIETSIIVFMYDKAVRAILNPGVQETLIGNKVFEMVKGITGNNTRRVVLRQPGKLSLVSYIKMELCTRRNKVICTDGIIDTKIPDTTILLGMRAIKLLGFMFYVGGQEAKIRESRVISTIPLKQHDTDDNYRHSSCNRAGRNNDREPGIHRERRMYDQAAAYRREANDEDRMSFLDEEEARQIREWDY